MRNVEHMRSVAKSLCAAAKPSHALEREVVTLTGLAEKCPRLMRDIECALQLLPEASTYSLQGSAMQGHVCSVAFPLPDGLTATTQATANLPCAALVAASLLARAAQEEHERQLEAA